MKNNKLQLIAALGVATVATATAGDSYSTEATASMGAAVAPAASGSSKLSGSISADWNSHFVSYGADVWGGGSSLNKADTLFVSVGVDYAISDALTFSTGFWLDVNDNAGSDVEVQETDVWFGLAYTTGITTVSLTYQNWQYGSQFGVSSDGSEITASSFQDSEEVLDLTFSFDTFLSPYITLHHRLDSVAGGVSVTADAVTGDLIDASVGGDGYEGTMLVVGGSHGFDLSDSLSLSIPVAVGFALDAFHTSEDGFAYASLGLQFSYALSDNASFNFGGTYYTTDEDVVGNPSDDFVTANAGVSYSF